MSIAVFLYLSTMLDWERISYIIARVQLEFIWQAFFLLLLSVLAMAIRWSAILRQLNIIQKILDSWRYYIISMFYGIMLPGIIGGDAVRIGLCIKQHGANKALLATSVLFERVCGLMALLMIASVTALLAPALLEGKQALTDLIYILALSFIFCFVLFFVLLKNSPKRWFNKESVQNGLRHIIDLLLNNFRNLPVTLLLSVLFLSFLAHFFDILGSYFLARALSIDQPLHFFLMIIPLVYILTMLPISLGGLGVREGVLTFFLVNVGVMASDAVLLALLIYLTRICVALIGGFIQFMDKKFKAIEPV